MTDPRPVVPHLAWPFRLSRTGSLAAVEQDTLDDVRQCVAICCRTQLGSRPLSPDSGVEDPTFGPGTNAARLERVIESQEPRAQVDVSVEPRDFGEERVTVEVSLSGVSVEV